MQVWAGAVARLCRSPTSHPGPGCSFRENQEEKGEFRCIKSK